MNTIMSLGILLVSLLVSIAVTYPDFPVTTLMVANAGVAIAAPVVCYPFSRMLWTAIDIAMRPLDPDEVDWVAVLASVGRPPARPDRGRGGDPPDPPAGADR